jgi:hypothetical protein
MLLKETGEQICKDILNDVIKKMPLSSSDKKVGDDDVYSFIQNSIN